MASSPWASLSLRNVRERMRMMWLSFRSCQKFLLLQICSSRKIHLTFVRPLCLGTAASPFAILILKIRRKKDEAKFKCVCTRLRESSCKVSIFLVGFDYQCERSSDDMMTKLFRRFCWKEDTNLPFDR